MANLLVRPNVADKDGRVTHVTPEVAGWGYVGFDMYKLAAGQSVTIDTVEKEHCPVIVTGTADIAIGGDTFSSLGGRISPFDDMAPGAMYVPWQSSYTVTAQTEVELAVCTAPGADGYDVAVILSSEMSHEVRGEGANIRHVRNILADNDPRAHHLLVVEVITPAGNWSSYPPHKHDTDALPAESYLEETYYHRLNPPQGFAFQRIYTDDRSLDETMTVHDGDVVMVPKGYHPAGTPFGYDLYYLNVMAGPVRKWVFRNDPDHQWMLKK